MMRHPLEDFVKAELAYREEAWHRTAHDEMDGARRRRRGRLHPHRDLDVAPPSASALEAVPPRPSEEDRLAVVHPLRRRPRRPDAA